MGFKSISWSIVAHGKDIMDSQQFYNALSCSSGSVKRFFFVSQDDISVFDGCVPDKRQIVNGTVKLHQLITKTHYEVIWRNLSCFCEKRNICSNYDPFHITFRKSKQMINDIQLPQSIQLTGDKESYQRPSHGQNTSVGLQECLSKT